MYKQANIRYTIGTIINSLITIAILLTFYLDIAYGLLPSPTLQEVIVGIIVSLLIGIAHFIWVKRRKNDV